MEKKSTDQYYAENVYPYWQKLTRKAKHSIIVFSPYVTNTVKDLLVSKHILGFVEKRIVTRVDADTIFDKPYQIRALINCSKTGIEILHLDALHAKLLIIDEKEIYLGSQNFTERGKENKETSVIPGIDFSESEFMDTIKSWLNESKLVDLEYLHLLEKGLKAFRRKRKSLEEAHSQKFDELTSSYESSKINKLLGRLREIERRSRIKFASKFAYINRTTLWDSPKDQETFLADSNSDLTRWVNEDGAEIPVLKRLWYYPMLHVKNSAIAFVRLGKSRISFHLTKHHNWGYFKINEVSYKIGIECPQEDTNLINIKFYFRTWYEVENCLSYFFDGDTFNYVDASFQDAGEELFFKKHFLSNEEKRSEFFANCLKAWPIAGSGEPIVDFLSSWWYKLYIIEYNSHPILVAE